PLPGRVTPAPTGLCLPRAGHHSRVPTPVRVASICAQSLPPVGVVSCQNPTVAVPNDASLRAQPSPIPEPHLPGPAPIWLQGSQPDVSIALPLHRGRAELASSHEPASQFFP